jgi:hypothetical protein
MSDEDQIPVSPLPEIGGKVHRVERVLEAVRLIKQGHPFKTVAERVGVTERTLFNWRRSDWWDLAAMQVEADLADEYLGVALESLAAEARAGDVRAADALARAILTARRLPRVVGTSQTNPNPRAGARAVVGAATAREVSDADLYAAIGEEPE